MVILILSLGLNAVAWVGSHCGSGFFIGGGVPVAPFIKQRFGPAPLGLRSRPMYM